MSIINITDQSFQEDVIESDKPVLVDFWAEWCGPCHRLHPVLEDVAKEQDLVTIGKLDIVNNPKAMEEFEVKGLPSLLLFKEGKLVSRKVGALSKEQVLHFIQTEAE